MDVYIETFRLERRRVRCLLRTADGRIAVVADAQIARLAYRKALAAFRAASVGGEPLRLYSGAKMHEADRTLEEEFQDGFYDHLRERRELNP